MPSCTLSHPLPSGRLLYITLRSDASGLVSIHLSTEGEEKRCKNPFLRGTAQQIEEYLLGKRRRFSIAVSPEAFGGATPFQISVWGAISGIPYGEARTYGEIAASIGRPQSSRAVGNALGRNPLPLIVPCHRVVSSSGIGGFSGGGREVKQFLLGIEGRQRL